MPWELEKQVLIGWLGCCMIWQCTSKCEATIKRIREVKKSYNYEMRMSLKSDPRRFEYQEVRCGPLVRALREVGSLSTACICC